MKLFVQAFLSGISESGTPNSLSLKQNGLMFPDTSYIFSLFPRRLPHFSPAVFMSEVMNPC